MARLTAVTIRKAESGKLFDGRGLTLVKSGDGGKWVYRYSLGGKRREMGLGPWPALGLAEARRDRDAWSAELAAGRDPIETRAERRAAETASADRDDPTFEALTRIVFTAKRDGLRGAGDRGRWMSPLRLYVIPRIGHLRGSTLRPSHVREAIAPIWRTKHPTAIKAMNRTRIVLRDGKLMGFPCDPFVAEAAERLLGEVRHIPIPITATPWQDVPALYARLFGDNATDDCLRWHILTLVRDDGCRGAALIEVDGSTWTVPGDRVKGKEGRVPDFRVPLSTPALAIVDQARALGGKLMFPGPTGTPVSNAALLKRLNALGEAGRPHGWRTSFRTWVQDTGACEFEVAETVLGHAIGNTVERSYARSDLLTRRAPVMDAWAAYVTSG